MGNCYGGDHGDLEDNPRNVAYKLTNEEATNVLSHVGKAAFNVLQTKHLSHQQSLWNVTKSKMIGSLQQTPTPNPSFWESAEEPMNGHSNWFPEKMCEIMSKTTTWCDVMSLAAPDGYFLIQFKKALKNICDNNEGNVKGKNKPIIIRCMFGSYGKGLPTNCEKLIKVLTEDLPKGANIQVWVGTWRTGVTWNHTKLIAVDGRYLQTGGHNPWSESYLEEDPVHDVSVEMEGHIAHDAHIFANRQWQFIEKKQDTWIGQVLENVPDFLPLVSKNRAIISEYPKGNAKEFAPYYNWSLVSPYETLPDAVPVISVGRQGALVRHDRPADDAIIAMIDSSKYIIRMSLQDLGPMCFPGTRVPLPGTGWPKHYFDALARAIWSRGVDVEIVLSNIHANSSYTNGWTCSEVGSEIIKRIESQFSNTDDAVLRQKVEDNLRICYVKHAKKDTFISGVGVGSHAKYFIVDDLCSYTGSQNLYVSDLAEWGVVIDDSTVTAQMIDDYWKPLWEASFVETDCDVHEVMDGLKIDREGEYADPSTKEGRTKLEDTGDAILRSQVAIRTATHDEEKEDIYGLNNVVAC